MDALDLKYAKYVLMTVRELEVAKKTDLLGTVKSHQVLDRLLDDLQHDGYLVVNKPQGGTLRFDIVLTRKGEIAADGFRKLQDRINRMAGETVQKEEASVDWFQRMEESITYIGMSYGITLTEDAVIINEKGTENEVKLQLRSLDKGWRPYLYCELDQTRDCAHVHYAWTVPKVQEFFMLKVLKREVNRRIRDMTERNHRSD